MRYIRLHQQALGPVCQDTDRSCPQYHHYHYLDPCNPVRHLHLYLEYSLDYPLHQYLLQHACHLYHHQSVHQELHPYQNHYYYQLLIQLNRTDHHHHYLSPNNPAHRLH